jgi:hypothetical protein
MFPSRGETVKQGYTRTEAEALVDHLFETQAQLTYVPTRTRGRVIEAIDVGDHWDVLIEWDQLHMHTQVRYDKFDVQSAMRPVQA